MSHTMHEEEKKPHDGRNVKRIREILKVKQSSLAHDLGSEWNQKKVSQLEDKETIDDKLMEEIAAALKVPVEVIKNFDDERAVMNIQNNYEGSNPNSAYVNTNNNNCSISYADKWVEAMEEIKKLYERLLQSEKEKVEMLQQLLETKK